MKSNYTADWPLNKVCSTHTGGEVPNVTLEPDRKGQVNIMPFSDVHFGAVSCNYELLDKHIELAKKIKAYPVFVGDLFEAALPSHIESSVWEANLTTGDQVKEAKKKFKPLRDRAIFSLSGNHDARVYKKTGFDVAEYFAESMGCFYNKAGGYFIINVGDQQYIFSAWHGASGSPNPWTEMENRFKVYDEADVTIMGNNHQLCHKFFPKKRIGVDGNEIRHMVHFVRTGAFLSEPDYSRMALYNPTPEGCPVITLSAERREIIVDVRGEQRWP